MTDDGYTYHRRGGLMTGSGRGVDLSVVVPMFNEQEVLPLFYLRLRTALDQLDISYEVVAVDDGSRDDTARLTESEREAGPSCAWCA